MVDKDASNRGKGTRDDASGDGAAPTVHKAHSAELVVDKIKQRLLGLLVVGILLLAFIPVIMEEPPTYLDVVPTRVPKAPVIEAPLALFEGLSGVQEMIDQQIARERQGYARVLRETAVDIDQNQALALSDSPDSWPQTAPEFVLAPLDFLNDRSGRIVSPAENGSVQQEISALAQGHALSRAWVVRFRRDTNRAKLIEQQMVLMDQRIASFIVKVPSEPVKEASLVSEPVARPSEEGQDMITYALMVGPELRREDAVKRQMWLQEQYPDTSPSLTVYFPGVLDD